MAGPILLLQPPNGREDHRIPGHSILIAVPTHAKESRFCRHTRARLPPCSWHHRRDGRMGDGPSRAASLRPRSVLSIPRKYSRAGFIGRACIMVVVYRNFCWRTRTRRGHNRLPDAAVAGVVALYTWQAMDHGCARDCLLGVDCVWFGSAPPRPLKAGILAVTGRPVESGGRTRVGRSADPWPPGHHARARDFQSCKGVTPSSIEKNSHCGTPPRLDQPPPLY